MEKYSEVTPVVQLLDNTYEIDVLRSSYKNIRWSVKLDKFITIDAAYEANLPGLAFSYYGDQELWRAVLAYNGLSDPINDIVTGTVLAMPDRSSLDNLMAATNSNLNTPLVL